jgi:UDP:flavonoid glycosyltransferase YjiC (YdhE family)
MRALMLPSGVVRAHLGRLLLVGRALREQGVDVVFGFPGDDPLIAGEGFQVVPVPEVTMTGGDQNLFAAYTAGFAAECVAAERAVVDRVRPDVVVSDLRPTAAITTRLTGVQHVVVVNAYFTRWFDPVDVLMPRGSTGKRRIASALGGVVQGRQKHELAAPFRQAARELKVRGLTTLDDFLDGDVVLLPDLPEYCQLRRVPRRVHYIGPLVWEGPPQDVPMRWRDPTRPLIYATVGDTGDPKVAELVLAAFAGDNRYQVLLTGQEGKPPAPNIHIRRFVPGSVVMRDSAAVIHCGGNGTTYQALIAGQPAVAIPSNNDQLINGYLLRAHNAGLPLILDRLRPEQVRAAVDVVQQHAEMRASARRFQDLLTTANGSSAAADLIARSVAMA